MKFFKRIQVGNRRISKLLGFVIQEQSMGWIVNWQYGRYKKFLGGLVSTIKLNQFLDYRIKKQVKIFNKLVIKYKEENNYGTYLVGRKEVYKVSLIDQFKKLYFKYADKQYDDIYILKANSGEICLTLMYCIDQLIKKNQSKRPLLVATFKYHVDLIEAICPELPYIYIKNLKFKIESDQFRIDNTRFFVLYRINHFKKVEIGIRDRKDENHYFRYILESLGLAMDDVKAFRKIEVSADIETAMLEKVKKIDLNLNKFVFLSPEAQSCAPCDADFWIVLINKLHNMGYDVFVNLMYDWIKSDNVQYKHCHLTFPEAFALAKKSKRIIALRSGLLEFLLQTGVPVEVLYTSLRRSAYSHYDINVYDFKSGFSLTKIPFIDTSKIREFNTFEVSPLECLNTIIKSLDLTI